MSEAVTVVILEDDVLIAEDLRMICEDQGARVLEVLHRADGAADRILQLAPDVALLDVRLGEGDGVDVAGALARGGAATRLVFVTGSNEPPTLERIDALAPHRVLIKPVSPGQLAEALAP